MARPLQDHQIRINEILDVAEELFYKNGYHQTMVNDIVKAVGVAKGTFYYYFTSKEDIIEALINRHLSKFQDKIEIVAISNSITPIEKIESIAQILFHTIRYKQGLLLEFLYNDQYLHFMDKLFRQAKKLLTPFLLDIMQEGNAKECFKVSNPEVAVNCILAILQFYVEAIYKKSSNEALSACFKMALMLVEKTLGVDEGIIQILDNT